MEVVKNQKQDTISGADVASQGKDPIHNDSSNDCVVCLSLGFADLSSHLDHCSIFETTETQN